MTRRARFFEIISNIFDFQRNRTGRSIALFVFGTATFGWFVTNTFSLVALLLKLAFRTSNFQVVERPREVLAGAAVDFAVSAGFFAIAFWMMWRNYHRNTPAEPAISLKPPRPHKGLILMLSTYNPRSSSLKTISDVNANLNDPTLRDELLKSNWATLVVPAQHHAPALAHCWIICTAGETGSSSQYDTAAKVVSALADPRIQCHKEKMDDANDISRFVPRISQIYKEAALRYNLEDGEIIADFTGGTSPMSGGMILATVDENRKVEYLRQDKPLVVDGRTRSVGEISQEEILVTISTSPSLVPGSPSATR
jgi:hypothetical protein